MVIIYFFFTGEELQCLNGFPRIQDVQCQMVGEIDNFEFDTIWLIPEMNFNCSGTVEKVTAVGPGGEGPNPMQLQIWKPENTTDYRRVNSISLSPSVCTSLMILRLLCDDVPVYKCKLNTEVVVEPGDILGIAVPHKRSINNFKLYSITESQLTSYIFEGGQSTTTLDLDLGKRINETNSQPLIELEIKLRNSKQGM